MSWRERDDLVANGMQTLQLGGEEDCSWHLARPSLIQTCNSNRIAGSNRSVLGFVVEDEGKHAVKVFGRIDIKLHILRAYQHISFASTDMYLLLPMVLLGVLQATLTKKDLLIP